MNTWYVSQNVKKREISDEAGTPQSTVDNVFKKNKFKIFVTLTLTQEMQSDVFNFIRSLDQSALSAVLFENTLDGRLFALLIVI